MTGAWEAARKDKRPKRDVEKRDNPFIKYELSDEQKAELRKAVEDGWQIWDAVTMLVESGYKLTLTWDDYSRSPTCFIFPKDEKSPNFGAILSGRGRSIMGAVYEAAYKHFHVFDGVWARAQRKEDEKYWDD